jgi:hypothetical protein
VFSSHRKVCNPPTAPAEGCGRADNNLRWTSCPFMVLDYPLLSAFTDVPVLSNAVQPKRLGSSSPAKHPCRLASGWHQKGPVKLPGFLMPQCFTCKYEEKREPTSGLEPLTCSLRVIGQALQEFARSCKCRLFRGVSLLRVAVCCTVLRSRWYQSGINRGIASSQYRSLAHASEVRSAPR